MVKAPDFDSGMRGFESFLPSHSENIPLSIRWTMRYRAALVHEVNVAIFVAENKPDFVITGEQKLLC